MSEDSERSEAANLGEMGFLDHLQELRKRIIHALAAAFAGMLACFAFSQQLYEWLMLPLYRVMRQTGLPGKIVVPFNRYEPNRYIR